MFTLEAKNRCDSYDTIGEAIADRFDDQDFTIYDSNRNIVGIGIYHESAIRVLWVDKIDGEYIILRRVLGCLRGSIQNRFADLESALREFDILRAKPMPLPPPRTRRNIAMQILTDRIWKGGTATNEEIDRALDEPDTV